MRASGILGRVSGIGASAGLAALLLWVFYPSDQAWQGWLFLAAAIIAGLCGLAILLLTGFDILFHPRRGARIRPVRAFDIVLGLGLVVLSLLQLRDYAGQLPV